MEPQLPWLQQGDIFADLPWVVTALRPDGGLNASARDRGAALLITEGCQMDKRTNSGRPKCSRLQFLPLRSVESLNPDALRRLRALEVPPPEAVLVGDLGEGEEAYGLLGEAFTLPAAYFDVAVQSFTEHPSADPADPYHLVARRNGERLGTLTEELHEVMHHKMMAFWTKQVPRGAARP